MLIRRLVIITVLLGALAVFLVYEHSRVTRAGYEISRLSRDEAKLVEQLRLLDVHVTKLRRPEFLRGQVRRMRIDLRGAPEAAVVPVAARSPEPTDTPDD